MGKQVSCDRVVFVSVACTIDAVAAMRSAGDGGQVRWEARATDAITYVPGDVACANALFTRVIDALTRAARAAVMGLCEGSGAICEALFMPALSHGCPRFAADKSPGETRPVGQTSKKAAPGAALSLLTFYS